MPVNSKAHLFSGEAQCLYWNDAILVSVHMGKILLSIERNSGLIYTPSSQYLVSVIKNIVNTASDVS